MRLASSTIDPEALWLGEESTGLVVELVVEDNHVNQVVAVALLAKLGYRADVAANGYEALEALQRAPYDLVLMDCQMPEMDGYEAVVEIRKLPRMADLPIVAMTAHAMASDREKCLAVGMNDYISKPVKSEKLETVIQQWVGGLSDASAGRGDDHLDAGSL